MDRPNSCFFFPLAVARFGKFQPFVVFAGVYQTNLYACTHGEVICKATSIFRHKYVWLCPWRGHLQSDQHFPSQICMTVPMARSCWKRPVFLATNLYDCTHGEVICKATSIFRHKFVWLYPRRGHLQRNQHFPSPICMTVPMARSFWLLATLHHFDFFLVFASFDLHDFDRSTKTLIFIDEKRWVV